MNVSRGLLINDKQILLPSQHSSTQLWMKIISSPIYFFITSSLPTSESARSLRTVCVACDRFACGNATYAKEMAMRGVLEKQNS
jgi:hypothetical protein